MENTFTSADSQVALKSLWTFSFKFIVTWDLLKAIKVRQTIQAYPYGNIGDKADILEKEVAELELNLHVKNPGETHQPTF